MDGQLYGLKNMVMTPQKVTEPVALNPSTGVAAYESGLKNAPATTLGAISTGLKSGLKVLGEADKLFDFTGRQAFERGVQLERLEIARRQSDNQSMLAGLDAQIKNQKLKREGQALAAQNKFLIAMDDGDDKAILDSLSELSGTVPATQYMNMLKAASLQVESPSAQRRIQNAMAPARTKSQEQVLLDTKSDLKDNSLANSFVEQGLDLTRTFDIKSIPANQNVSPDITEEQRALLDDGSRDVVIVQGDRVYRERTKEVNDIGALRQYADMGNSLADEYSRGNPELRIGFLSEKSPTIRRLIRDVQEAEKSLETGIRIAGDAGGVSPEETQAKFDRLEERRKILQTAVNMFNSVPGSKIREADREVSRYVSEYELAIRDKAIRQSVAREGADRETVREAVIEEAATRVNNAMAARNRKINVDTLIEKTAEKIKSGTAKTKVIKDIMEVAPFTKEEATAIVDTAIKTIEPLSPRGPQATQTRLLDQPLNIRE